MPPSDPEITRTVPLRGLLGSLSRPPTIRSSNPSPLTSPAPLTASPKLSLIELPSKARRTLPSDPESTLVLPLRSSPAAPTTRSAIPSPLTSPAPLTEMPKKSLAESPKKLNRALPSDPESTRAPPRFAPSLKKIPGAPTIRSSNPSPLTSPAPLTELPKKSLAESPLRL